MKEFVSKSRIKARLKELEDDFDKFSYAWERTQKRGQISELKKLLDDKNVRT